MKLTSFFIFLTATLVYAQDLKTTVNEVLSSNPIVLERLKNYNATKEDVTIAKSGYYPKIDLSLGVGHESTDKDTPALGKQSFDYSVYQNSLTYTHNLFKGFQTNYRVAQQESRTTSAAYHYIEKVNDTSFKMVNAYLNVMKNKELLETAKANVKINSEIFVKVQKLYDAGLTTLSEVNKIESSLSLAKSNLVVQENTLLDVQYNLHKILGRDLNPQEMSKPTLNISLPKTMDDATQFAIKTNPSLLVSEYNIKLAQATYKEAQSPFYPSFDIEISQSMNKNLSGVEGEDDRFRAMAFVTYNLFNGFADSAAIQKNISNIHQEVELKNQLRREVIEGLRLSWASNEKLKQQMKHLKDYKSFSLKTLTLYAKEYDLGRRSLLDLLSAQNDFIGSKSQIINTEYNMLFAKYRILDAMGILVSTVTGNTNELYSNVGLSGKTPQNNDTLPIQLDRDNDLIPDDEDICNNSLSSSMKNLYGCLFKFDGVKQIERYTGFLFEPNSITLTDKSQDKMNNLILQLKADNISTLKFDILGHAQDKNLSDEKLLHISKQRAILIKKILIDAGSFRKNIKIYAKADTAPIYLNGSSQATKLNNRVDIIVKKPNN
jgi:adhesin transport system outer membrane protein